MLCQFHVYSKVIQLHIYICLFPGGSDNQESACNAGEMGSIPGSRRSPGEGNGNPRQQSGLENPMDGESGRLQSRGSRRVRHDLRDFTLILFEIIFLFTLLQTIEVFPVLYSRSLFTILNVVVCLCEPYNFLSMCDLVCFLYQGDGGLMDRVWECSFLCNFWEEFQKDRYQLFTKYLNEFTCEAI